MSFDFHTHTTFSDGVLEPEKLVRLASKRGIKHLSITDHDTISNYEQVKTACEQYNIEMIMGIEISSSIDNRDIHILAYFENENDYFQLKELEEVNKNKRVERLYKICKNLSEQGVVINPDEIMEKSKGKSIARPQIAQAMVDKGYVKTVIQAFDEYLYDGSKVYVPASQNNTYEIITLVRKFGGLPSLAHPSERFFNKEEIIIKMVESGLQGIEIHHPSHDLLKRNYYTNLCRKYNLAVTGGSDYHGIKGKEDNLGKTKLLEADYQRFKEKIKYCFDNKFN